MQDNQFTFSTLPNPDELEKLNSVPGTVFSSIHIEKGVCKVDENLILQRIDTWGLCTLVFYDKERTQYSLKLESEFITPAFPIVGHGKLVFEVVTQKHLPIKQRLEQKQTSSSGCSFTVPVGEVKKIKIWGNEQTGFLNELYPDIKLTDLKNSIGSDQYSYMSLNSIEGISVEGDSIALVLILQEQGFFIFIDRTGQSEKTIRDNYLKINGYEKNIVLKYSTA
ncbi:MAG: hypothetical protein H6575_06265 [Lewinellaceae bacterium]|nr:hypothetical protein [Saprospiraceae bacterium]MCB9354152.1 hypothetical protein [Lewinellaceae bacterium]